MLVCHTCDTSDCINPEHLFLGTYSDNVQDAIAKGRHRGWPYSVQGGTRGEKNHMSRLTEDDVRNMRRMDKEGVPRSVIVEIYKHKVGQAAISMVINRRRWAHVS
jgi:hypothetical protein